MTKWISVKERLPEFDELVLTFNPATKFKCNETHNQKLT